VRTHFVRLSGLFIISLASLCQAKDDGFNGKWVLDGKSQQPDDCPKKLETVIKQDGSGLTLESRFQEPETGVVPLLYLGIMATKVRLASDGQVQQNAIGPFQMASKSTVDGKEIQTEWTASVQGDQVQGHWTQRLADDGKHMVWEIKETSSEGGPERQVTLNFVRK
jgi:hypothetical protein